MGICRCGRKPAELVFAQTTACLLTSAVLQEERRRNKLWISSAEFRFFSVTADQLPTWTSLRNTLSCDQKEVPAVSVYFFVPRLGLEGFRFLGPEFTS